jgi:hypothetical protein
MKLIHGFSNREFSNGHENYSGLFPVNSDSSFFIRLHENGSKDLIMNYVHERHGQVKIKTYGADEKRKIEVLIKELEFISL